jgi:hypothetical protein
MSFTPEQMQVLTQLQQMQDWQDFKRVERQARGYIASGINNILTAQEIRADYTADLAEKWQSIAELYQVVLSFPIPLLDENGATYTVSGIAEKLEADFNKWLEKVYEAQDAAATVGVDLFPELGARR